MHQEMLIYISKASRPLSTEDTERIAVSSAARNRNAEITGLLLQIGDYFVQVLEGQSQRLSSLLKTIESDARHSEINVLYKSSAQSRMFSQWNMGYFNIEQYYQVNRKDLALLRQCAKEAFTTSNTSKEAIVQVMRSVPTLMQNYEVKKTGDDRYVYAIRLVKINYFLLINSGIETNKIIILVKKVAYDNVLYPRLLLWHQRTNPAMSG